MDVADKDHVLQVTGEASDIRMEKRLASHPDSEKQLFQQAKMAELGELVTGILHEINNPLSFIIANLGNLHKFCTRFLDLIDGLDQVALSDEARQDLAARKEAIKYSYLRNRITEMIESSLVGAERMRETIQAYKSFSRMSDIGFAEADIHKAIDSILALLHHQYKDRIAIKKHYGAVPPLCCSIAKLSQVFMNLLVNAIQAIEGPGEIEITTGLEAGEMVISIRDTGSGMPESVLRKIFTPFFTTKPDGVGTGLGLSITKGIMDEHRGRISVASTPGKGTTFTLKLPLDLKAGDMEQR